MKKRAFSLVLVVVMLCSMFPLTASAFNESEATATVTYTKEAPVVQEPEPDPDPAPVNTYEINIPALTSLNQGNKLPITANYLNLTDGQTLTVSLDLANTFGSDGYFQLKNDNNDVLRVAINRHNQAMGAGELISGEEEKVVAVFNNTSEHPVEYGLLYLNVLEEAEANPGTYSGVLYFKIDLATN
jgi:hypothetical protein